MSSKHPMRLLIAEQEIKEKIASYAERVNEEYAGEEVVIVMIMKGALVFVADLIRNLHVGFSLDSIHCSSYGERGTQQGELKISGLEHLDVEGKHVLVADDIFDSGRTMAEIVRQLGLKKPKSLKSIVLLTKKVPHKTEYRPDYSLFDVEDLFVVGYGLDYKEFYRGLPGIFEIAPND